MKSKLIVIGLIIVVFLSYFFIKSKKTQNILGTNNKIDYSLDEINLHSSKDDCWTIIDNQVYNVTDFISQHPGGEKILLACGTDATNLFNGISPLGRVHSAVARGFLSGMKIGDFKSN